ncbi:sarcosine oxidase subunit gamma [Rhodobacter lacus]|uniref:Sarcosine oxidase subunit gamma n=1 Tax=Rhodobacter lacus TaxID=1641972 RepID=A0ABW5AAB9_9RHOB
MSEMMAGAVSPLNGKTISTGFATVAEVGLKGMVSLRADLGSKALAKALKALGLKTPAPREIVTEGGRSVAWMSPDELLVLCGYAEAVGVAADLEKALAKEHALVANVSDARAMFTVAGARADEVLMKLCPVDFAALKPGEMRRTRSAQVAAALWRSGPEELSLICFRSVAGYVMGLLEVSSRKGGEIF